MWVDEFRELSSGIVRVRTWASAAGQLSPTVVLAHGLGGSVLDWDSLAPLLARTHHVIAFDMPGFGLSGSAVNGHYGLETQVEALAEIADAVGEPVDVIGNSMGGLAALRLAVFAPELVRSLTLLSPALPDKTPRLVHVPILAMGSQRIGPSFFDWYLRLPRDKQMASKVEVSFSGKPAPQEWLDQSEELLDHLQQSSTIATAYSNAANDLLRAATDRSDDRPWALAGRVSVPVLVTHSAKDQLVKPELRYEWAKVLPTSRRAFLLDAGHVPQLSAPELVERTWRGFVSAV